MKIGEIIPADRDIVLNEGRETITLLVANKGDRPVQVGSHYHFSRQTNVCLLTGNKHMDTVWISLPEHPSASNPARKKKFSSPKSAAENGYSDLTICPVPPHPVIPGRHL